VTREKGNIRDPRSYVVISMRDETTAEDRYADVVFDWVTTELKVNIIGHLVVVFFTKKV